MKFKKYIIALLIITLSACKTQKNVTNAGISTIATKKIISNHYNNSFNQKTIYAKINAKYKGKKASATVSVRLRLEKDKTIWLSATKFGIPLAKVKITPTRVSYYEKLSKTYFDGDFTLLSNWLGTELDYEKVQNILLGQAVMNLRKGKYISSIENNLYEVKPKKDNDLFGILFFLNPENFKVNKQEINNPKEKQLLSVSYPIYNLIEGEQFPKKIDIRAIDNKDLTTINIEYKSVEFNKELTFPFEIPNGYKEITLK
ncbi:DUF4292 domain-containing protein [Lutibacter sp. TH_r2]|uniref:DUF4292 domain-containing protein n=1 Tax=Lutibacter sp. TH_r2 TaxID=3082083 RepID=UPI002954CB46|nr:DUF4292 domain-containing protein [Lutibacter sp. TH_r2]MDV7186489.1 DUF4292 domain-containing protein [Lutibacter sp. TH_r2]